VTVFCRSYSAISFTPTYKPPLCRENGCASAFVNNVRRMAMGKYFIAWLLGVPAFVLVLIYLFMH